MPERMEWRAQLLFTFRDSGKLMRVHVFAAEGFAGEPVETEEMAPRWFDVDAIPYAEMWHDDTFWLPRFLAGERFEGWFDYAAGGEATNRVLAHEVVPLPSSTPPGRRARTGLISPPRPSSKSCSSLLGGVSCVRGGAALGRAARVLLRCRALVGGSSLGGDTRTADSSEARNPRLLPEGPAHAVARYRSLSNVASAGHAAATAS